MREEKEKLNSRKEKEDKKKGWYIRKNIVEEERDEEKDEERDEKAEQESEKQGWWEWKGERNTEWRRGE